MRLLPVMALVLASLAFSVGGVVVVGHADSSAQSSSQSLGQSPAATAESADAPQQCRAPKPFDGHMKTVGIAASNDTIPLNTRGYNYALPGDVQMDPTGRTSRGAQKAEPAAPPAAPAK